MISRLLIEVAMVIKCPWTIDSLSAKSTHQLQG